MAKTAERVQLRVGPQGRIVIPAAIREKLGIAPGDTLYARLEDGRLILETQEALWERIRSWFASVPPDVSLVDELIAERREEARREEEELAK